MEEGSTLCSVTKKMGKRDANHSKKPPKQPKNPNPKQPGEVLEAAVQETKGEKYRRNAGR